MSQSSSSLPAPVQGLVINFNYLWALDSANGDIEARKARPCIIVAVANPPNTRLGIINVVGVLPLTHTQPGKDVMALPVLEADRQSMGLDSGPCWVICGEMNSSIWPGYDLLRTPTAPDGWTRGKVPPLFLNEILSLVRSAVKAASLKNIPRK